MKIKAGKENDYKQFVEVNSHDAYSNAVVTYAQRWADLMEASISSGERLVDVAKETSHKADTDGITGFMYGCAVNALSQLWEYGDELRRWHNNEYNYDGDGVVNPAIISISKK